MRAMNLAHPPRARAIKLFFAVLTAFLTTTAAANAATPINLGSAASTPRVVVNDSGTGYLTWADEQSNQVLHYCRLAQGAAACDATQAFTYPGAVGGLLSEGNSPVLASGGRILLVDARCCVTGESGGRFVYTSTDGGATFTPTTPGVGNKVATSANGMQGNVLFAGPSTFDPAIATERLLTIADTAITNGADFQGMATSGAATTAHFGIDPDVSVIGTGSSRIGLQGSTLLAAYTDTNQKVFTRRYNGGGNENLAANWSAPLSVADAGDYDSEILTGTAAYLTYPDATRAVVLRLYDGSAWGAPVAMTPAGVHFYAATEDPSGIVHIVYVDPDGTLKYRYARSAANNDFTNPQVLGSATSSYFDLRLAIDSAGNGFATWNDHTSGFAQPIVPGEGPGDGSTIPGDTQPVDTDTDIVLTVPANCTATNSEFTVGVALKKHKHHRAAINAKTAKKKTKRKIVSAAFYKGNVLITKVKHKPFQATVSTQGVPSGTLEITVKVKIKIKKPGHKVKKVKKTLKANVQVC
jgi:hypothetical protein